MKKEMESFEPTIGDYYDDEERDLIEGIEEYVNRDDYVPVSTLTPERRAMLQRVTIVGDPTRALEPTEK